MTEGWVCPVCRRGKSPGVQECDHGGQTTQWPPPDYGRYVWPPYSYPWGPAPFVVTCGTPIVSDAKDYQND